MIAVITSEELLMRVEMSDAYEAYIADVPAWEAAHPGENAPSEAPYCKVIDPNDIKLFERIFLKYRLKAESLPADGPHPAAR